MSAQECYPSRSYRLGTVRSALRTVPHKPKKKKPVAFETTVYAFLSCVNNGLITAHCKGDGGPDNTIIIEDGYRGYQVPCPLHIVLPHTHVREVILREPSV